ncbi:MAG: hypothetical protein JNN11_05400 [Candidatus Doudnabacteria bacterium]|nr:hypothetical protein [Candidatus Doudnabacteria bacterium]
METAESEIINKVITVLEKASEILTLQLSDIENIGRSYQSTDENEANKSALLIVTKRNSLEFFRNILDFLIYRLRNEKIEFFVFYLPQIRVMIELYSYLQYICNLHEDDQLILILTNNLFTLSSSVRNTKQDFSEIQALYTQQKNSFQYWLDEYEIIIPEKVDKLTKKKMNKQKLTLVPVEQRLNANEISKDCPLSSELWKGLPNSVYEFYRKFSLYVHGNPLMAKSHGTENFWIISECLIYASMIIELVNSRIIENKRLEEHKKFLYAVKMELPKFINLWGMKRQKV